MSETPEFSDANLQLFISRIKDVSDINACWEFERPKGGTNYNYFKNYPAHRWIYEYMNGAIDPKLDCHHTCSNIECVNPDHLQAITHAENTKLGMKYRKPNDRPTHCRRGHELTEINIYRYIGNNGYFRERCRMCRRLRGT